MVEGLLLAGDKRKTCVNADPLKALFQTDYGIDGTSATGRTSFLGMPIGDIKLTTDGMTDFKIIGSGRLENEDDLACRPIGNDAWTFTLAEADGASSGKSVNQICLEDQSTCGCDLEFAPVDE